MSVGSDRITVTAEQYGMDPYDDHPDVIVVRIDGEEVGAYCIVEDTGAERESMERMVRAVEQVGADVEVSLIGRLAVALQARAGSTFDELLEKVRELRGRRT